MEDEPSTRLRYRAQRWTAVLPAVGLAFAGFAAVPVQAQDAFGELETIFVGSQCVGDVCINRTLTSKAFPVEPVPKAPDRGATMLVAGTVKVTFAGGEELAVAAAGQEDPPCDVVNATPLTTNCVDSPLGPDNKKFREVENLFTKQCVWNAEVTITKGGATVFHTDDGKFVTNC